MVKQKVSESAIGVLWEGLKLYCTYFPKYGLYMLFPVLGQFAGLFWIFGMTYLFVNNLEYLTREIPMLGSFIPMFTCLLLIILPGMILWMKAFWDYLVAYGALNSMTVAAMSTGKIYDFPAHNAVVTRRSFKFIALWLIFGLFTIAASIPFLWVLGLIFFVYFVLIFQVFTFEEDVSPSGCFKRSLMLIKGNFARTLAIMTVLFALTYYFLELGVSVIFDALKITPFFLGIFEPFASMFPLDSVNTILEAANSPIITPLDIAHSIVQNIILFLVVGFTLPLRSIIWTLWYKNLSDRDGVPAKVSKSSRKKLDPEILKRAKDKE